MAKFKVGDKVRIVRKLEEGTRFYWNPNMDLTVGKEGEVFEDQTGKYGAGTYGVRCADEFSWYYLPESLEAVQDLPKGVIRIAERGQIGTTEFATERDARTWLADNGITGEFELFRVESLGKVKASVTVEAV